MNFFLDNTFAPGLAKALAAVAGAEGHAFMHMQDLYPAGDPGDCVWIPAVAARPGNWRVLSGDRRLYTTPQNREALSASGLIVFFMPSGFPDLNRWDQASRLFKWFPSIVPKAAKANPRELFDVQMNGKVERKK